MQQDTIGIIGAGVIGTEVTYQYLKFGYRVYLFDVSQQRISEGLERIKEINRFDLLMQKNGKSSKSLNGEVLKNIQGTTNLGLLEKCNVVIENVTEKFKVKKKLYLEIRDIIPENALVAANTSATSITKLGSLLKQPENFLGIHFVNPVHLIGSVELIRGTQTSEATIARTTRMLASMGMKGILVNDSPGFVSNRIMLVYINESIFCLQENVGSVDAIDRIFKQCLAHKMGPLETADLIGLDTVLNSLNVLYKAFKDSKYRPAPLLTKMVDSNYLGRKTGKGFYEY